VLVGIGGSKRQPGIRVGPAVFSELTPQGWPFPLRTWGGCWVGVEGIICCSDRFVPSNVAFAVFLLVQQLSLCQLAYARCVVTVLFRTHCTF